jgi:hypothetical protein
MKLKKEFPRQDSLALLLCVCVPPAGYALAWRRHWLGAGTACVAALLYLGAIGGMLLAGYPHSANDIVVLQALWGVLMVIAISGDYLAERSAAVLVRALLALLIGASAFMYTPHVDIDCMLRCGGIGWRTLRGQDVILASGAGLLAFLASLYGLFALALWTNLRHAGK